MSRRRPTRVEIDRARRDAIWRIATDAAVPASWADWFACKFPTLASVDWGAAPIDLRQGFARDLLSTSPSEEAPGGTGQKYRTFTPETDRYPNLAHPRFTQGGIPSQTSILKRNAT